MSEYVDLCQEGLNIFLTLEMQMESVLLWRTEQKLQIVACVLL